MDEIKKRLSTGPTITREGQLQRFLRSMTGKQVSTKESYDKKYPSDSKPVFIYGTPEIQKLKCNNVNDLSLCSIDKKHVESSNCTSPLYFKLTLLEICRQELNKNLPKTVNCYGKSTTIEIIFSPYKVGYLFNVKESVPKYLTSFAVYWFTCVECNVSYIGETAHHLATRIKEHLETNPKCPHFQIYQR